MNKNIYLTFFMASLLISSGILIFHFNIDLLPPFFITLGLILRICSRKHFLVIFSFLFPLLSAFGYFQNNSLPFNYLLLPLFMLSGIYFGEWLISKKKALQILERVHSSYLIFLLLIYISAFFVLLRWSNLTLSPSAFFKNTPVDPTSERISFSIIFIVIYLGLFGLSYLYYLYLKQVPDKKRIIFAFLAGHALSIFFSYLQHFFNLKLFLRAKYNGMASDSSSFGFLSSISMLLSWYIFAKYGRKLWSAVFFAVSLLGIINSFTKIAAVALAFSLLFFLIYLKNYSKKFALLILVFGLLATTILFISPKSALNFGFVREINKSVLSLKKILKTREIDQVSMQNIVATRYLTWNYAYEVSKKYPLDGVGAGNFLFWVKYKWFGKNYRHHLPHNQYLMFSSSVGLIGLSVFLFFVFKLWIGLGKFEKWIFLVILIIIFTNHYFWFPESLLSVWMVAALGGGPLRQARPKEKKAIWIYGGLMLLFLTSNLIHFNSLHPKNWAKEARAGYDYGFWYEEKEVSGKKFRWAKDKAGLYIYLDQNGFSPEIKLFCGAPLDRLPLNRQKVEIFWKGKKYTETIFKENTEYLIKIEGKSLEEGFLEFRIHPSFNLHKMGLSEDNRDLGIQIFDIRPDDGMSPNNQSVE